MDLKDRFSSCLNVRKLINLSREIFHLREDNLWRHKFRVSQWLSIISTTIGPAITGNGYMSRQKIILDRHYKYKSKLQHSSLNKSTAMMKAILNRVTHNGTLTLENARFKLLSKRGIHKNHLSANSSILARPIRVTTNWLIDWRLTALSAQ